MHTWSLSSVHVSVTGPWISVTLTHSYNIPLRDLRRSYGSALLMCEWLFSLPCHRSSAGLWFWQMIQIHLVFLTWAHSAPPASAKWCCLPEKNKLFWRDVQKALWWLNWGAGWERTWPERAISRGRKSAWVKFFSGTVDVLLGSRQPSHEESQQRSHLYRMMTMRVSFSVHSERSLYLLGFPLTLCDKYTQMLC